MSHSSLITGPERRRRWREDEKHAILMAAFSPGAVVVEVARHYEISTTANVLAPQIAACHDAGMDDHIAKPISPRDLLEKVTYWCETGLLGGDQDPASQAAASL